MKIILGEKELECKLANGRKIYHQSAERDSLEFVFEKGKYTVEELDQIFSNTELTKKIILKDGKEEFVHDDYRLKISIKLEAVETQGNTNEQMVTEERVTVTMAQLTFIEKKLFELGVM